MKNSLVSILIVLTIVFSFSCLSDAGSVGTSVDLSNAPQIVDPIDDNSYVVNVEDPTDEEIIAEEEAKAAEEAAKVAAEEAAKKAAEEEARLAAEEAAKIAAKEAEEAQKAAEKAAKEAEKAAEQAAKKAEQAAKLAEKEAAEQAAKIAAEQAAKKAAEEEAARIAAEEAAKKAAEEEAARIAAEEAARLAAEEAAKKAAEEEAARLAAEEAAKLAAEEAAKKAAEEAEAEEEDVDAVLEPEFLAVSISDNNTSTLGSSVSLSDYNILINANNATTGIFTVELDFEVVGQVKKNAIFLVEIENAYGRTIGGIFVKVKSTGRVTVRGIVKLSEVDQQITLTMKHKNDKNAELLINGLRIGKKLR